MSSKKKVTTSTDLLARACKDIESAIQLVRAATDALRRATATERFAEERQSKPTGKKLAPEKPAKPATKPAQKPAKKPATKTVKPVKPAKAAEKPVEPTGSTIPTVTATPERAPIPRHKTPASARLTPHEVTLNIGSHPVKELAENDAKDLLNNPKVFWYRPTQFPDPRRYQVQPRIEGARVIKRSDAKFSRAPWTVSVTIALIGDDKRCDSWGVGVLAKNKADQE